MEVLHGTQVVATPVQTSLSADIEDLVEIPGVLRVAAPLLDDLMTAFGWQRCFQLERDGTVRLGFWGSGWTQQIEGWAQRAGLPVVRQE